LSVLISNGVIFGSCDTARQAIMARQIATSTSASATTGEGKLLPTVPDGKTPRPPRRRKQQQTAKNTSAAPLSINDFSSSPNDEEYSFASSTSGTGGAITGVNSDPSKSGRKAKISMMSVTGKENSINDCGRCRSRIVDGRDERTKMTVVDQQRIAIATKTDDRSKSSAQHKMQELNDGMAKVTLGRKDTNSLSRVGSSDDADSVHRMGPFPPKGFVSNTIIASTSISGSPKYVLQNSLQMIEKTTDIDLGLKNFQLPSMMNVVASESFSLGPSESMLLEENTAKLIDTAKRCLKSLPSATPGSTSKKLANSNNAKVESELALMRVALYSLRSILPTILESNKSQSIVQIVIKLLYHCVVISGDVCHGKFETFTTASTSSSSEQEGLAVIEYAIICLGAYEGLGKCLNMGGPSSTTIKGAVAWDELILLPDSGALSPPTILPHRQLVKIAIESTLCASSSFLYLSLMSIHARSRAINELWTVPNEFHFSSSVIDETCSDEYEEIPTFQKLLNVANSFVIESLLMGEENNDKRTLNVDALRHVRKGFRILWDGARTIEGLCTVNNPPSLRICSLDLQSEAIHFILRSLKSVLRHFPDLLLDEKAPSTTKEIFALFDRASASAIKSANVLRILTETDQTNESVLIHFHSFVGAQLDFLAMHLFSANSCGEVIPLPSSYYEYFACRLIHRWRLLRMVENDHNLTSLLFDKNWTNTISCGDSESMVGAATSTLIHMVLLALQSLTIDSDPTNISDPIHERIILNFELIVIKNSSTASQSRCRSMLTELDLQREASKIISSAQSGTSYSTKGQYIAVVASVLWRCYAPLETKLSQSTKDQARSLNFRLASADSCGKSALLYGVASEDSSLISDKLDEYAINADLQLQKCYEVLVNELSQLKMIRFDRKAPTILAIEMFAKAASYLGRRRYEKKEFWASILPQLFACDVLTKVATKASDKELFNTYQVSSRYMLLSSALDASGKYAESCAALALAACCALECSPQLYGITKVESNEGDLIAEKILLFHETALDGRSQDRVGLSAILTRLTRTYIEHRKKLKDILARDCLILSSGHSLTLALKNTIIEKIMVAASTSSGEKKSFEGTSLGTIFYSKLLDCAVRPERDLTAAQIAGVVRDVLRSAIKVAKFNLADDYDFFLHVTEELNCFLQAQKRRLDILIDPDLLQVLSSSFHVTFALQLFDSQLFYLPRKSSWALCENSLEKQEFKILQLSCMHLQLAERQFAKAFMDEASARDACFFVQWAAVQFHLAILSEYLSLAISDDAQTISHSLTKKIQLVTEKHTSALCSCSSESDDLQDVMIRRCLALTYQVFDKPSVICSITPELRKLLCQLCECLDADTSAKSENTNDAETIDTVMAAQITLGIQRRILVTTMLMLNSKICIDAGKPSTAAVYLGWCRVQCRECVRCLRFARSCSNNLTLDDIAVQVDDILTMCYEQLASAFCLLGIRRKAEDHALLSVLKQRILSSESFRQVEMQDLVDLIDLHDGHECFLQLIRSLMKVKSLSSSPDLIVSHLITINNAASKFNVDVCDKSMRLYHILCKSKNALAFDVSFQHVPDFRAKYQLDIDRIYQYLSQYSGQDDKDTFISTSYFTKRVCDDLKLRIHHHLGSRLIDIDLTETSRAHLEEITGSRFPSGICNAEAYYRLGLVALSSLRKSGELQRMWAQNAVFPDERQLKAYSDDDKSSVSSVLEARQFFRCALMNAPPASFDLTKNILRCLALVTGPTEGESAKGLTSATLIHMSVGGSSRNIVQDELNGGKTHALFQAFEDESLDYEARIKKLERSLLDLGNCLPTSWNISTLATCPTGELIVSSICTSLCSSRKNVTKFSNACIFPATESISNDDSWIGIRADVLRPFDRIIERSQNHLQGMTEEIQLTQYDAKSARREWWRERRTFDEDLQKLLQHAERKYFSRDPIQQSLIPDELFHCERDTSSVHDDDDDDNSECSDSGPGNVDSKFAAVESLEITDFDMETEKMKLMKLTVSVIKSKLVSYGVPENAIKKRSKSDLVHLLLSEMETASRSSINSATTNTVNSARKCSRNTDGDREGLEEACIVLILDEHLQRFPLESMEMLSNIAITRVPSLPFVHAILLESEMIHSTGTLPVVDPTKLKYVIDPESNLSETASTLGTALYSMASKHSWKWEGVVGRLPPVNFMSEALAEEDGMYLFCGHGGGENAFSRSQVEALLKGRDDGIRGCRSSVVLMGCSSGKLQSVNTPKLNPSAYDYTMHYEPEGIALSYLYAGAPCVVGNLWDVTDRDIDRYCLTLMEDFFRTHADNFCQNPSLAKCVAYARRACKLRFIVGSAPVCYGLPVASSMHL
ncbi:hypothetical protein ACHAXA_011432, partial [Cyclostephanos tholiformis]